MSADPQATFEAVAKLVSELEIAEARRDLLSDMLKVLYLTPLLGEAREDLPRREEAAEAGLRALDEASRSPDEAAAGLCITKAEVFVARDHDEVFAGLPIGC